MELEVWNLGQNGEHKGIDDLLNAGQRPQVLQGEAIERELSSILGAAAECSTASPTVPEDAAAKTLAQYPPTDSGNGERFLYRYRHVARYLDHLGKWAYYNGQFWDAGPTGVATINRLAKDTARSIQSECPYLSLDESGRRLRFSRTSEGGARIREMLTSARSESGASATVDELDLDPYLFNLANGTLDLRTGRLQEHRSSDLITKMSPVEYDPDARCPCFLRFVREIMGHEQEMVEYLQRIIGLSLTGVAPDREVFFLFGSGQNGKSTLLNIIHALLGPYAKKTPAEAVLQRKSGEGGLLDLADLAGARFVSTGELPNGRQLNEARIKDLTGRDTIKARKLYRDYFEYAPKFKLVMVGNHRPEITGTDDGIWDRVKLIPFETRIQTPDPKLPDSLRAELPGILNWAIEGCLAWSENGLQHPEKVCAASGEYRQDEDPLHDFISERCITGAGGQVTNEDLYGEYDHWCKRTYEPKPLGQKQFSRELIRRGFEQKRKQKRYWIGISLRRFEPIEIEEAHKQ